MNELTANELNDPFNTPAKYIVGIGASAGGLEAIEAFFKKMPANSGLAFVVVQHLSPDYKSLMVELLSKHTEMPVNRIEDGVLVKENNIYLLPPRKNLSSFHGRLLLTEQDHSEGLNLPIDIFFRSLAEDMGEYAISVVLSGTGSDGTRGIRAIKERGGMVMVQDDETAKFDGMPKNAIATGLADFILPPDEMPKQLLSFVKHPYASAQEIGGFQGDDSDLTRIFLMLREKSKVDFTYYKPTTVLRRIERRVSINQLQDLSEYVRFLQNNPNEVATLFQELLIGVTCFFRDELAFDELRDKWLGNLIEHLQDDEIRLWVAACSTGEEAYSLAMLLAEYREHTGEHFRVKIFATDVDHKAVEKASNGIYPASIAADVPPELLSKYFIRREDNYQVSQKIREMVVFAQHNLIKDPPFTNIHLLSCRNVLIYLQSILQRKILALFNFSLVKEGILMLGASESVGEMVDYFDLVGPKWKIYRSKGKYNSGIGLGISDPTPFTKGPFHNSVPASANRSNLAYYADDRVLDRFVRGLADDLLPFTLIVNEHAQVTHVFGDAKDYLAYPSGKLVQDVTKIVKKDLSIPIATAIKRALSSRDDIILSNIRIREDQDVRSLTLRVKSLPGKKGQDPLLAIFISETVKKDVLSESESLTFDVNQEAELRISDLEHELQFTRENLQATVEELETSNEELQATNEELLASNEELQSTNEELQSVNEELYTVNAEYQGKITELTLLNNDLDNLFNSTQIATLFLDENLDIRRFTPKLQSIFHIMAHDIDRPYSHLSHRIVDINLGELINSVMLNHQTIAKEVQIEAGNWFLLRISPYAISDNVYAGVILTFVDIDQLKKTQFELQQREQEETQRLATMVLYSHDAITLQTLDGQILTWNRGAEELYGWTEAEALQMNFMALIPETEIGNDQQMRMKLKNGDPIPEFEAKRIAKNGTVFSVWVTVSVLYTENHHRELITFTERDIRSKQSAVNNNCASCVQRVTTIVLDSEQDAVILLDTQGNIIDWNHRAEELYGWQGQEMININIADLVPAQEQALTREKIQALVDGETRQHDLKVQSLTRDGCEIKARLSASPLHNPTGEVVMIVVIERHPD
jgi:two-component system CheB/CheR fusion protein